MRLHIALCLCLAACGGSAPAPECPEPASQPRVNVSPPHEEPTVTDMTLEELDRIVRVEATGVRRERTAWEMTYQGIDLVLLTDPTHDRMRIVAGVIAEQDMNDEQRAAVMAANFHTALDARYATSRGVLYATFIHPLSSLNERDLRSAIRQVATLAATFGTQYSSGELVFGAGAH